MSPLCADYRESVKSGSEIHLVIREPIESLFKRLLPISYINKIVTMPHQYLSDISLTHELYIFIIQIYIFCRNIKRKW